MPQAADGSIVIDTDLDNTGFQKGSAKMERAIQSLCSKIDKLGTSIQKGLKTDGQFTNFEIGAQKAKESLEQLDAQMAEMANKTVSTVGYEQYAAAIEKAEQALFKLYDKRDMSDELGVKKSSAGYKRLQLQIQMAEANVERLREAMASMESSGKSATLGGDTAQYQQMKEQIDAAKESLAEYEQQAEQLKSGSGAPTAQPAGDPGSAEKSVSVFSRLGSVLKSVGSTALNTAANLAKIPLQLGKMGAGMIGRGISSAVKGIRNLGKHSKTASDSSKGLVKSLLSLKTMMLSRLKRTFISEIMQGLQKGIQSLAKYSSAFNKSMSGMQNAATGLSGNLAVTFGNLVNAVAPAITTIINLVSQVISYINALFAMLSGKGTVTVAKKGTDDYAKSLKGAAGAAKDLNEQVYGFDELNKAQDKSSGGGGGGSAGTPQYEDVAVDKLLPEDLYNTFQQILDAFKAGDWEGMGLIIGDALNGVTDTINNWIVSVQSTAVTWSGRLAEILNGMVQGINWSSLGALVGNGLNTITRTLNTFADTFSWDALGERLGNGLNSLATTLDTGALGQALATKFNVAIGVLHGAVMAINWPLMGNKIALGITGWFNSINWEYLTETVSVGVTGVFDALTMLFDTLPWGDMGLTIANVWNTLDWEGMLVSFSTAANSFVLGAFEFLNTLVSETNWQSIGGQLAHFLDGIDVVEWLAQAATLLSGLIKGMYDTISGFIEEVNWAGLAQELWDAIVAFIATVDYAGIAESAFEYLGAALGAVATFAAGLATAIWNTIKAGWEATKEYFTTYFDAYGGDVIAGLCAGIVDALADIGEWIKEHIAKPFIDGIATALGVDSSDVIDAGKNIITGLYNGLVAGFNALKESIKTVFEDIWTAIKGVFGINSPSTVAAEAGGFILQGLVNGFNEVINSTIETIKGIFGGIWDAIKGVFGIGKSESDESKDAKQAGKDIMTGMQDGVTEKEEDLKTKVAGVAKTVVDTLKTNLGVDGTTSTQTKPHGEAVVTGVKDGIESKGVEATFTTVAGKVNTAVKNALNKALNIGALSGAAKNFETQGEAIVSAINKKIGDQAKESTFTTNATTLATAIKSAINTAIGYNGTLATGFEYIGQCICRGVAQGISANTSVIESAARTAASAAYRAAKKKLGIASPSKVFAELGGYVSEGLGLGIERNAQTVYQTMGSIATRLANTTFSAPDVEMGAVNVVSGMEGVTAKLSNIAATFDAIAAALDSIGGFTMPAIAAGTVVPYKTRVAGGDASYTSDDMDAVERIIQNFDDSMSDQGGVLRQILAAIRALKLVVDSDAVEKMVTSRQRERELTFGGVY